MSLIAATGGTGTLGQNLVRTALQRGHEVRVISRRAGAAVAKGAGLAVADVLTGQGLEGAFDGAEVVIHAATSPYRRARATEIEGTRRVVEAATRANAHLLYVSIVGVDRHRFPYYQAKFAAEQIVAGANIPFTIARATQFHQLVDLGLRSLVFPVTANMRFQTIDPAEFAVRLCDLAESRHPVAPLTSVARSSCPSVRCDQSESGHWAGQHCCFLSQPSVSLLTTTVACT